jgi:hypothetical protein
MLIYAEMPRSKRWAEEEIWVIIEGKGVWRENNFGMNYAHNEKRQFPGWYIKIQED